MFQITKLNWLGDWGTQFGLLLAGMEKFNHNLDDFRENSIFKLYQVYVDANKEAEQDSNFRKKALELSKALEDGNEALLEKWKFIRDATIQDLEQMYERIGVKFDHYHGEAMYAKDGPEVVDKLEEFLTTLEDGRRVVEFTSDRRSVIQKSDGSTLYITRDIAAALHRVNTFNFDKMLYVVENGQRDHFINLFEILTKLGRRESLQHVNFGRILGMSTRKGTAVFLTDVLDEGMIRMREMQLQDKNTRDRSDLVTDILASSAVMVNDLKRKRTKDYDFCWKQALATTGDTGVKLQYTHSRLSSLINSVPKGIRIADVQSCLDEPKALGVHTLTEEANALGLLNQLAKFDEAVRDAYVTLEPSFIVQHLFGLCQSTSRAWKTLPVQGAASTEEAMARLALFSATKTCLSEGMQLLGLNPLSQM